MNRAISQLALVSIAAVLIIVAAIGAYASLPQTTPVTTSTTAVTTCGQACSTFTTSMSSSSTTSTSSISSSSSTTVISSISTSTFGCAAPCVEGYVIIGPLCPVEQITTVTISSRTTTTASCPGNFSANFTSYRLNFSSTANNSNYLVMIHISPITPGYHPADAIGTFEAQIPAGTYKVFISPCSLAPQCQARVGNSGNQVQVSATVPTNLTISVDTGIR